MNICKNSIKALSFGLIYIFSLSSFSLPEAGESVTKQGVVNDDYYAAGGTVNIDADIAGDIVVSGGNLFIGHRVQGDVMAAGGSINIRGKMLDDVRIAGGEINIDANISDDLIAAGGEIRVSSQTAIGGNAWLAGGEVDIAGTVNKGLIIAASTIRLSGIIRGDVRLEGEDIHILPGARIEGNLYYRSLKKAKIHADAKIIGSVTHIPADWIYSQTWFGIFFSVTLIFAAFVLFLLFPVFTMSAARRISASPWKSLGVGFALLVLTPIVAVLLMSFVIGMWVGMSVFAFYFVALIASLLFSCFFLGDWGARMLGKDITSKGPRLLSVILVIIILGFMQLIPGIGILFVFALLLLGFGAGILELYKVYKQTDKAAYSGPN